MGFAIDPSKVLINIQAIRTKMATDGKRRAVIAGARVIGDAMVEGIPVQVGRTPGSNSLEPGELKASVKVRSKQIDGEMTGLVGPSGENGKYGKVAYNVEYGHRIVTGGESKLGADGKFHGPGRVSEKDVPAHPCLRPAFEASAAGAIEAMGLELAKVLKEAVK